MKELMERLMNQVGLSQEQASGALGTVQEYLQEKFPMMEGIMEKFMGSDDDEGSAEGAGSAEASESNSLKDTASSMMDGLKEKAGGLMDGLEDKLDDLPDGAKDALGKLKDMFGK